MKITALEIAEKHNGTVEGDENILLTSLAKIQDAKKGAARRKNRAQNR